MTWLGERICVFLVGNWASGYRQAYRKRKGAGCQKAPRAKRQETLDVDKSFCDTVIFLSERMPGRGRRVMASKHVSVVSSPAFCMPPYRV